MWFWFSAAQPSRIERAAWRSVNVQISCSAALVANIVLLLGIARLPAQEQRGRKSAGVSDTERQALIALFRATDGSHWTDHVGWLGPPGTECDWHGVQCWSALNPRPQQVTGIDLAENNLVGTIPESIGQLSYLTDLNLLGNHLSGELPQPLIQQWLAGTLQVLGEASLLTDISKIEYEVSPSALLCGFRRVELEVNGRVIQYETRCRGATPDDRTTFCEVKDGKILASQFSTLAWVFEKNGFFHLKPNYSGNVSDSAFVTIRATRNGKMNSVEVYAWGAPVEFSIIRLAVEGAASSAVEWQSSSTSIECPKPFAEHE